MLRTSVSLLIALVGQPAWAAPVQALALPKCPQTLHTRADVDAFTLADSEDRDFATLSGESFELDLVAIDSPNTAAGDCLLMERVSRDASTRRRFVEIRTARDGSLSVELAGYTPSSHQLYSIRARLLPDVDSNQPTLNGRYDAALYDGSGPSREKLSRAQLTLETSDSE